MKTTRKLSAWPLVVLALMAMILSGTGCDTESDTVDPLGPQPESQPPVLPDPARLTFDFGFFDQAAAAATAQDGQEMVAKGIKSNFFNAYLRVIVIHAITNLVLTPPVAAFAVALHTLPSPQQDGSYIWVYTFVNGDEEVQIRLRGRPIGGAIEWELRVTALSAQVSLDNEVWFAGTTRNDGDFGQWRFYDPTLPGDPAVADLEWGTNLAGDYLMFTCLHGEDEGDTLAYRRNGPFVSIEFTDASAGAQLWFIRWDETDGSGSLMVPDYNGGEMACWDANQDNTTCETMR
jgi:hypothetical protein